MVADVVAEVEDTVAEVGALEVIVVADVLVVVVAAKVVVMLVVVVVEDEELVVEVDVVDVAFVEVLVVEVEVVVVVVISAHSLLPNTHPELFTAVIFVLITKHFPVVST